MNTENTEIRAYQWLVCSQRARGIDAERPADRDPVRQERDRGQERRGGRERRRIHRTDAEHERAEVSRGRKRRRQAESHADGDERTPIGQHEAHYVSAACAERNAHGDLTRALRDSVCDNPVESYRRKQYRHHREAREQAHHEQTLRRGSFYE